MCKAFWENVPFVGDALGQLANITEDGLKAVAGAVGEVVNNGADFAVGEKRKKRMVTEFSAWLVDKYGDQNQVVDAATGIVKEADNNSVAGLIAEVLRRSPDLIDPRLLLNVVSKVITGISLEIKRPVTRQVDKVIQDTLALINSAAAQVNPELLLTTVVELTRTILTAILAKVGQLGVIQSGIFSNEINAATLGLVWSNRAEVAEFLIDLAECTKCYASAISLDGKDERNSLHGQDNEFDFSQAMNRHALTCQVQRLAKSVILILKKVATPTRFTDIRMTEQTTLQSDDIYGLNTVLKVRPSGWQRVVRPAQSPWVRLPTSPAELETRLITEEPEDQPHTKPKVTKEKWLFVNGIATELFWLHLACKKLAKWYSREVTGVYNRGDGILWDLIECAGERDVNGKADAKSQKNLIQRTRSSEMAQESLKEQLQAALEQADGEDTHVVMIAHSQGCLILRLVLEELLIQRTHPMDSIRKAMWDRLCVFTFGNPSVDWKLEMDSNSPIQALDSKQMKLDLTYLSSHCLRTEHFANKADFVAKLGVLSEHKQTDSGYAKECVFVNRERDWIGHLFGTQYSLRSNHYKDEDVNDDGEVTGDNSWLLACEDGVSIRTVIANRYFGG